MSAVDRGSWPHRSVGGAEANQLDLIHGCCVCCLVPWPCPAQSALDEAVLSAAGADLGRWRDAMAAHGWETTALVHEAEAAEARCIEAHDGIAERVPVQWCVRHNGMKWKGASGDCSGRWVNPGPCVLRPLYLLPETPETTP